LLREDQARLFLDHIEDRVTRQLIEVPYREVLRRFGESFRLPIMDFDLAFFVEGLFLSCSCHERIEMYLDGIDHRWFPEDDDEIRLATLCPLSARATGEIRKGPINLWAFELELLLRSHEARWLTCSLSDTATIQIVGVALAAFRRHLEGRPFPGEPKLPAGCPLAPVDLLFAAEVLIAFADQKDLLRSILVSRQSKS
jgi:hypothetical protein